MANTITNPSAASPLEVGQRVRLTYPREGAAYPLEREGEVLVYDRDSGQIALKYEQGTQNLNLYEFASVTILSKRKV